MESSPRRLQPLSHIDQLAPPKKKRRRPPTSARRIEEISRLLGEVATSTGVSQLVPSAVAARWNRMSWVSLGYAPVTWMWTMQGRPLITRNRGETSKPKS